MTKEINLKTGKRILKPIQETFCLKYCEMGNATKAALAAGYAPSYAAQNSGKLMNNSKILARIKEIRQAAEDATIATVVERKRRLTEMVRATIPDYLLEDGIKVNKDSPNVGAVSEITTKSKVFRKGGEPVNIVNLKLHSPIQAISELNKMEGVYSTEPPVNQDNRVINIFIQGDEAKRKLERLLAGEKPKIAEAE